MSAATNDSPSAPIDPMVKSSTVSQVKNKKVKGAAIVAATQADEDDMSTFSSDHPYLSVLYKRMRSHRKKLEKIKALEHAQESEGKVLNAQQVALMSNKGTLTKLVAELEMLREQFVAVFKQEMQQLEQQKEVRTQPRILTTESVEQVDAKQECHEVKELEDGLGDMETQEVSVVQDVVDNETVAPVVVDQDTVDRDDFGHVYELLKTLHVVNLHQAIGKDVPMVLDFFSKVVLGNTRPPAELSYEENLLESLEEAKKYLMESDKVFACETTYRDLRAFVDQLVTISSQASSGKGVAEPVVEVEDFAAVVDETPDVPVVPAEINTMPQISFFTESQLELELANEAVAATAVQVETAEVVAAELEYERGAEVYDQNGVQTDVAVQTASFPAPIPVPPFSFAAVAAAGVSDTRVPSPAASVGSSDNDKKEVVPGKNSLQGKNPRRRGQERWKEKDSNSNRGGTKSGNGSPTNGSKPRRSRGPRTNDETGVAQGGKRSTSKEDGRPRVFRGLRKRNGSPQEQHTGSLIAPHA
uniref:Caprin-1 dimerization domain-containing protein n=1 Tax=Hyaloperonospora arabidopsidis (strain Emoy2) TaxID=559515 RepID=M4BEQ6_HYAAE